MNIGNATYTESLPKKHRDGPLEDTKIGQYNASVAVGWASFGKKARLMFDGLVISPHKKMSCGKKKISRRFPNFVMFHSTDLRFTVTCNINFFHIIL